MLDWCYFTERLSCGWVERDGIGVAFRRTPTGRDAAGRSGAFFVHALVWEQGTMAPEILARLWDADLWVAAPPDEPPAQLDPIQSVEDLRLGLPASPDNAVIETALAGFLDNLSRGRRTALAMAPELAMPVAATLAGTLPQKFGLLSFSTWERDDAARRYELIAGDAASPLFESVGPRSDPGGSWRAAARLLLSARAGTAAAAGVVDIVGESSQSPSEFASALERWSVIEATCATGTELDAGSVSLIASDPRLVERVMRANGAKALAGSVLRSDQRGALVEAARHAGCMPAIVNELCAALVGLAPADAIETLQQLDPLLPLETPALAATLAGGWPGGHLAALSTREGLGLAKLVAKAPGSMVASAVRDRLVGKHALTTLLFGSRLPPDWRAAAAAAYPTEVDPGELVESMMQDPGFTTTFVERAGNVGLTALGSALAVAPIARALPCAEQVAARVAPAQRLDVLWPVILRLHAPQRLAMLDRYAPMGDGHVPGDWADVVLDAYVETLLAARATSDGLPRLDGRGFEVASRSASSSRVTAWMNLATELRPSVGRLGPSMTQIERAAGTAIGMQDPRDVDAALELVVDTVAELVPDPQPWASAMLLLLGLSAEPGDEFAKRVARAALRPTWRLDRSRIPRWTIRWVADALDRKALSSSALRDPSLASLHERLWSHDVDRVLAYANEEGRRRTTRRWLLDNAKEANRRFRG